MYDPNHYHFALRCPYLMTHLQTLLLKYAAHSTTITPSAPTPAVLTGSKDEPDSTNTCSGHTWYECDCFYPLHLTDPKLEKRNLNSSFISQFKSTVVCLINMNVALDLTHCLHSDEDEQSTDNSDLSDVGNDWFGLVDATANWMNIYTYVPRLNSRTDSTTNSNINSGSDSQSDDNFDLNESASAASDLGSEPALSSTVTGLLGAECGEDDDLALPDTFEPMTPQSYAFGEVRELSMVCPILFSVLVATSHTLFRRLPSCPQPVHTWVYIAPFPHN